MTRKINININSRTFYVALGGNDAQSGESFETAKASIQSAIDEVNALSPPSSASNPTAIITNGAGLFAESGLVLPDGCQFDGGNIFNFPITGNAFEPASQAVFEITSAGTIASSTTVFTLNNKSEVGLQSKSCVVSGATSTGVHVLGTSDDIFVTISQLKIDGTTSIGVLDEVTTAGAPEIYNIDELTLEANDTVGFRYNPFLSTATAIINMGLVGEVNGVTGTIGLDIQNGTVDAFVNTIDVAPQLGQGSGSANVEFWLRKNGTDIVDSNIFLTLGANSETLPYLRWKERFTTTDTFEIVWASSSANTSLDDLTSLFTGPNIPSIMLGVTHVGS